MSTSLRWSEVPAEPHGLPLSSALKGVIAQYVFNQDGSSASPWTRLGRPYILFFDGVMAATNSEDVRREAQMLRDLIRKQDVIQLRLVK